VFQRFILPFLILQRWKLCNFQIGLEECFAWVYFVKGAITKLQNCRKTNRFVMKAIFNFLEFGKITRRFRFREISITILCVSKYVVVLQDFTSVRIKVRPLYLRMCWTRQLKRFW